ncbi:MAG: beta-lactamase family protein, partial [Rectinema sp.]|nr:beta-lactamase family protein [Rectinema sp.]
MPPFIIPVTIGVMKILRFLIPWLLVGLIVAASIYLPDLGPESYQDFDSFFSNERIRQGIAGYQIAIIKEGKVVFSRAYGFDGDRRTLDVDTPLYIGPSSEIITGTLLYQLTNLKRIDIDTPVSNYIPELSLIRARTAGLASIDAPLTLRQLAAHRVAFPEKELASYDSGTRGLEAGLPDPALFLKSHFPTEKYTRSRLSYRLVGAAMEKASGVRYPDLVQTMLTIPLGMYLTTAEPHSLNSIAMGAGTFFGLTFPYRKGVPVAAAASDGIVSSARDLATLLKFIVSPEPGQKIPGLSGADTPTLYQPLYKDGDTGFGWRIIEQKDGRYIFQGGSVRGYSSRIAIYPERRSAIIMLVPQDGILISNFILPELVSGAQLIMFKGSAPRLFPMRRAMIVSGIIFMIYLGSMVLQTLTAYSWARDLRKYRETSFSQFYARFTIMRTIVGLIARGVLIVVAPWLASQLVGRSLSYAELISFEPGFASMALTLALLAVL